jgi:phage shock protein A
VVGGSGRRTRGRCWTDYSYERQLELLQQVRRGLADVATSRKRVELQLIQLQ